MASVLSRRPTTSSPQIFGHGIGSGNDGSSPYPRMSPGRCRATRASEDVGISATGFWLSRNASFGEVVSVSSPLHRVSRNYLSPNACMARGSVPSCSRLYPHPCTRSRCGRMGSKIDTVEAWSEPDPGMYAAEVADGGALTGSTCPNQDHC